jgi:hypothetical protein
MERCRRVAITLEAAEDDKGGTTRTCKTVKALP